MKVIEAQGQRAAQPTYGDLQPGDVFVLAQDNSRDGQNRPRLKLDDGHVVLETGKAFSGDRLSGEREVIVLQGAFVVGYDG